MDNQHRKITGYRDLTEEDIDAINLVKQQGIDLGELVAYLEEHPKTDKEWVQTGRRMLQQGLMALTRSIAKPDFF